ncbi:MAG: flagellar biosynthetic protein FliR, partial [Bacteriovoracaceae bacterium]
MINIAVTDYNVLIAFWLVFTRWTAILVQLPLFDNTSVPNVVKVLMSVMISYAFFPVVKGAMVQEILAVGPENFWYLTIFHTVVGVLIGFLVKSIMNLFVASGSIMTQQIGFGAISYFDPSHQSQVGPFEKIIEWTIIIMILTSGALLPMFKGVINSFFSVTMENMGNFTNIHVF